MEGDDKIRDRKFGRELAADCLGLAREQFPNASKEMQVAFWEAAARSADSALTALGVSKPKTDNSPVPMTRPECFRFEKTKIPFGKFSGKTVGDIMEEQGGYLDWLCRETEADRF